MATSNAQRFLAKGGVDDELALEMFYGAVLESFHAATVLWNTVDGEGGVGAGAAASGVVSSQVVNTGKSWQFPLIGNDGQAEYHTPGTELLGQQVEFDEGSISIDGILVKHFDIPVDQIQLSHFPVLEPVAKKIGRTLATTFDKMLFITAVKAALSSAVTKNGMTIHNGGNVVERVDGSGVTSAYPVSPTGARNFRDDVEYLARLMDEDHVPEVGRYLIYTPRIRQVLQQDLTIFDERYQGQEENSLGRRIIGKIAGFDILPPTTHMPDSEIGSTSLVDKGTLASKYQGDFTYDGSGDGQPVALALCGSDEGEAGVAYVAAGDERLNPIYTHMMYDERRNTHFMKGQMMVGAGVLAPYSAGAIIVDDA